MKPSDNPNRVDPSASRSAFESPPGLAPLMEIAFDAILIVESRNLTICYANRAAKHLIDTVPGPLVGEPLLEHLEFDPPDLPQSLLHDRAPSTSRRMSTGLATYGERQFAVRCCPLTFDSQPSIAVVIQSSVASESGTPAETSLTHCDPLTGLPNRTYVASRIERLLSRSSAGDPSFAVLFIDLDDFKRINDTFGHLVGDQVLKQCAQRLKRTIRTGDRLARYGGDEFIVLVEDARRAEDVESVVARIRAAISHPIALPEGEVSLSASVGVAHSAPEFRTVDQVLSAADRAMYASKSENC